MRNLLGYTITMLSLLLALVPMMLSVYANVSVFGWYLVPIVLSGVIGGGALGFIFTR